MVGRNHPFEIGQLVETRSFLEGFRGSWFRCKVKNIKKRNKDGIGLVMEYVDFPDEKITWTPLYAKHKGKRNMMVRPCFPSVFRESELPDSKSFSEVVAVMNDALEVGDAVDWWTTSSFWSGWITEKLGDDNYEVTLWPLPDGEGSSYKASGKDLRPTLEWSHMDGWKTPEVDGKFRPCARLVHPTIDRDAVGDGKESDMKSQEVEDGREDEHRPRKKRRKAAATKISEAIENPPGELGETGVDDSNSCENKMKSMDMEEDESAILNLVELLHKVRWMKRLLNSPQS